MMPIEGIQPELPQQPERPTPQSEVTRLGQSPRRGNELSHTDKLPNYALLFAKIFFKELVKPSEPTMTDPFGNFSWDLSKEFPTIKEEKDNRRDQSSLSSDEKEKLADYEQAVVRHRFSKRVFAEEGLKLERGLIELQAWETDPELVEVRNTPEVREIIDNLRRSVVVSQLVLEEDGQYALVAKAQDNARDAQQPKGKQ